MRPGPVLQALSGGLTHRRVQTIVITLVVLMSTGASVLGLALAIDSSAPFSRAFAAQHGADVTAAIDPSVATPAELAAPPEHRERVRARRARGRPTATPPRPHRAARSRRCRR